ncbi:hypothetical protein ACFFU1_08275 [Algibacter miyuki]|uniref:Uncharacterized protein n=1 Tax=Algibacter miyuki TaxID=1306933 RepID=A0ABV5GZ18_9FLAO|nr:hypothetical protein [Algibacter miyuki]MDN3666911.1 hypothetical protein [Algibacter miyuki]
MTIQTGFIKLYRDLVDWEWYTDLNTCKLFIHCLIKANYSTKKWQGITIRKGEFITSKERLAIETGLSISKVRTALDKLLSTKEIKLEPHTKYTKVIITSDYFDDVDFQVSENSKQNNKQNSKQNSKQSNKNLAIEAQTNRNLVATTKKEKEENIINRKNRFKEDVFALTNFSNKILNDFYNYWSEVDTSKNLMRFESQTYWELDKRLDKWLSNEKSAPLKSKFIKNR